MAPFWVSKDGLEDSGLSCLLDADPTLDLEGSRAQLLGRVECVCVCGVGEVLTSRSLPTPLPFSSPSPPTPRHPSSSLCSPSTPPRFPPLLSFPFPSPSRGPAHLRGHVVAPRDLSLICPLLSAAVRLWGTGADLVCGALEEGGEECPQPPLHELGAGGVVRGPAGAGDPYPGGSWGLCPPRPGQGIAGLAGVGEGRAHLGERGMVMGCTGAPAFRSGQAGGRGVSGTQLLWFPYPRALCRVEGPYSQVLGLG